MSPAPADQVDWLFRAGADLHLKGELDRAKMAFERLLTLAPRHAKAALSLGFIAMQRGEYETALSYYERAAADGLDVAELHNNRGVALRHLGREIDAAERFRAAVARSPRFAQAWGNLGASLMAAGDLPSALPSLRRSLEIDPTLIEARSTLIFSQNYLPDVGAAGLKADAEAFDAAISRGLSKPVAYMNSPEPERRLKVGFVSGDFRNHAVARFLVGMLAALDTTRLEFHAHSNVSQSDETTARLKTLFAAWTDIQLLDDEAAAREIAGDEIDILVDLSGYTDHSRLPMFARKPAPVAVTCLGYSGTTGIGAIDYVLADSIVLPPSEEAFFSETPWRLPDSYLCYAPPAGPPEVAPLPAIANDYVTFGSFNNLNKLSDKTIALWARVVRAVPSSRLVLKGSTMASSAMRSRLIEAFLAAGLDADRVVLLDHERDGRAHLAAYGKSTSPLIPFPTTARPPLAKRC